LVRHLTTERIATCVIFPPYDLSITPFASESEDERLEAKRDVSLAKREKRTCSEDVGRALPEAEFYGVWSVRENTPAVQLSLKAKGS
jgi:hypothetical protein